MTRSRKKRKAALPASPADCSEIEQVDGPAPSPSSSQEERQPLSAPSSSGCMRTPTLAPLAYWAPPPAPPWSRILPSNVHGHLWLAVMASASRHTTPASTRLMLPSGLPLCKQCDRMRKRVARCWRTCGNAVPHYIWRASRQSQPLKLAMRSRRKAGPGNAKCVF